jgi:xanthine dehydrogenase accessory factor
MTAGAREVVERALRLAREGRRAVACLVVGARGSTPQAAGALMLVDDAAVAHGTIGGGCVEAEVRQRAFAMLAAGRSGVLRFTLDHDYGWDDGLICGGTITLAVAPIPAREALERIGLDLAGRRAAALHLDVEGDDGEGAAAPARYILHLPPRDRLLIAGAGHVGAALARQAQRLDFEVTVFDDRADLLERCGADGAATVSGEIAAALAAAPVDAATYCVIVTRGHRHDARALDAVVGRGARYVGMIGSRRKVKLIFDELRERGVDPAALESVHAPIGLDIGAVLVEEIATSIAAQMIAVRRETAPATVEGPIAAGRAALAAGPGSRP